MRRPVTRPTRAADDVLFAQPEHLRPWADALPSVPGVYIFHGEVQDALPLYIGKSVNLRARVLSHLRNPEEARMLRQARSISYERTGGDIGALLREAQLIKLRQPLYNQRLRRSKQLCALRLGTDGVPEVVFARDLNFATTPDLFGLYGSRSAALDALRDLADLHRLCYGRLGLERLAPGRGCFRASLRQCAGVCRGDETAQAHEERLRTALEDLRVVCWDWPGAVGLRETDHEGYTRVHVVRHWCYLGSVDSPEEAAGLDEPAAGFDADGYRVLCRPLLTGRADLVLL